MSKITVTMSKITVTFTPSGSSLTFLEERVPEDAIEAIKGFGGNRASNPPIIMPRRFVTIEELVEMEYNTDFINECSQP